MYEIIVVGGGHAGCEAANAAAKQGFKTALITSNVKNIADYINENYMNKIDSKIIEKLFIMFIFN